MPLSINFELSDRDLEHFNNAIKAATFAAGSKSAEEVSAAAGKLLEDAGSLELPDFIMERLDKLDALIAMLRDEGWALPEEDRARVLSALVYFADPKDIIPDNVPVLGFLDDAIMIDVVQQVLAPEIEAYADFCKFREQETQYGSADAASLGRQDWLDGRRAELQLRMRQRRSSYAPSASWRPTFRVS
jgi:uncharacterized membrane protein YkvA (DUF1232 family)